MQANMEYILAGLIILVVLPLSYMNISAMMSNQQSRMEQENRYPASQAILDMILLSPGNPPNWGNQSGHPIAFGLAAQNALDAYTLDMSKVSRLRQDSPNYISPSEARQIMGLTGTCHFSLTVEPLLTLDIMNVSSASQPSQRRYNITVTDHQGFRVPNVNLTGFYVPRSLVSGDMYPTETAITKLDGTCTLFFASLTNTSSDHSLVVSASQLEVKTLQTYPVGLPVRVEGPYVLKADYPVIPVFTYSTGSFETPRAEISFRYANIEGLTYYIRLQLWRFS